MTLNNTLKLHEIKQGELTLRTLPSGEVFDIMYQHIQINLIQANIIDGQHANIYLRFQDDYRYVALINQKTLTDVYTFEQGVVYQGQVEDVQYTIQMTLFEHGWTYDITLSSDTSHDVQLYYGQDIGIQDINGILNNEAYIVQYIDFKAFKNDSGYTLCARQNQGRPAYFQMGMREKTVGFVTDAMQFFTPKQKMNGHIYAMDQDYLDNSVYQYESSYLTLQSETFTLSEKPVKKQFYGYFEPDHPEVITAPKNVTFDVTVPKALTTCALNPCILYQAPTLEGLTLSNDTIQSLYPTRLYEEKVNHDVFSFFLDNHVHVMTKQKELVLERPQGHMILQGDILNASEHVMSTTTFMSGVFMSHISLGNTSFHKMLGDHRHPLMLHRMSGLRLYIKHNDTYHLLGIPSIFEVGHQHVTWLYVFEDDAIDVTLSGHVHKTQTHLSITSKQGKSYEMLYTMQLLMGPQEWLYDLDLSTYAHGFSVTMPQASMAHPHYPDLTYAVKTSFSSELKKLDDGLVMSMFTLNNSQTIDISAAYGTPSFEDISHEEAIHIGRAFYKTLLHDFDVKHTTLDVSSDVTMVYWYAHNALIHYASPHGLEQYNGAAWGTRDVCQGPFEFFSAIQQDDILVHILKTVYSRQFFDNGDFPQWFMYDKYYTIQAHEAHGDIIYWPLKALSYYLKQTGNTAILDEKVPYFSIKDNAFTKTFSIIDHVKYQLKTMFEHVIHDLPIYGGGDWDDTLQPANQTLKEQMVSGWTAVLMIQTIEAFIQEINIYDPEYATFLTDQVSQVKDARKQYLLPDGIPAGFVVFDPTPTYLLHPKDQETTLSYRLLPLIRSMIAGLTTPQETASYINIIDTHLKHPDGVRLMNTPVTYLGGDKKYFNRAETAANFGREIGLQYVHAHIRYIEAMLTVHEYGRAHEGLQVIHPINLIDTVPHALPRQRNTYFSSSDGQFKDRYEAKEKFDLLRSGDIPVKGGWRIYSSGPGILIHQIITGIYGIHRHHGKTMIQPKLPDSLKEMTITFKKE